MLNLLKISENGRNISNLQVDGVIAGEILRSISDE